MNPLHGVERSTYLSTFLLKALGNPLHGVESQTGPPTQRQHRYQALNPLHGVESLSLGSNPTSLSPVNPLHGVESRLLLSTLLLGLLLVRIHYMELKE